MRSGRFFFSPTRPIGRYWCLSKNVVSKSQQIANLMEVLVDLMVSNRSTEELQLLESTLSFKLVSENNMVDCKRKEVALVMVDASLSVQLGGTLKSSGAITTIV